MITDVPLVFSITTSRELVLVVALLATIAALMVRGRSAK